MIYAIASGIKEHKNEYKTYHTESNNIYLNYGLLGLVTKLHQKGLQVKMYQGDYYSPQEILEMIGDIEPNSTFLLSIPSFFSLDWAIEFANLVKDYNIIIGGRWVKTKFLDKVNFVLGCPDEVIHNIIENNLNLQQSYSNKPFDKLDYTLINNFNKYQPCIEVSRGCDFGCGFCLESKNQIK